MADMVETVLNADVSNSTDAGQKIIYYSLSFKSDSCFYIKRGGVVLLETETIEDLASHWRRFAVNAIHEITNIKIKFYESKQLRNINYDNIKN